MNETTIQPLVSYYVFPGLELNGKRSLFQKEARKNKVQDVVTMVCDYYQIDQNNFYSSCKSRDKVGDARKIVCYLCFKILHITLMEIGSVLHRDHTTVIIGIRRAEDYMTTEELFAKDVYHLTAKLFN